MDELLNEVNWFELAAISFLVWFDLALLLLVLVHYLVTLPMRRAERARLFLELIETAIKQGRPVEETIISLSHSNDRSMGLGFHLLASWLEKGLRLGDALAKAPRFLPPQITAMLNAGQKIGDLRKVLPSCRQLLKDAVSQTRGAMSYLFILTFVITPSAVGVFTYMSVELLPKLKELGESTGGSITGIQFLLDHAALLLTVQVGLLLLLWHAAFLYIGGPRVVYSVSISDWLHFHLPWRRKRLQRDFSTLLAILLDSGVPEPEAVGLAADGTANRFFAARRPGRREFAPGCEADPGRPVPG